jgi:hypothetical protein
MTPTTELVPLQQYESGLLGVGQSIGSLEQCEKVHASHFPFFTPFSALIAISLGIQAHLCIRMRSRDGGAYHRNREETRMQLDAKSSIPIEQVIPLIIMTSAHQVQ